MSPKHRRTHRVVAIALMIALISMLAWPLMAVAQTATGLDVEDGATVSGTVEITGNVAGDNLSKWELLLFPNGEINDGNKVYLTGGTEAGEVSYELDTTKYPDGTHALVLRVVDPTSNYTDYPVSVTVANAGAPAAAEEGEAAAPDIVDIAVGDDRFETLVTALQAADLVGALQGEGPFTVFAPTDDAFAALGDTLTELVADPEALANVLLYHVVPGTVMSTDLSDGLTAETLQGSSVTFTVSDEGVQVDDANVILADIEAANGVIHVIDAVITPPAEAPVAAAPAAPAATGNGLDVEDGATVSGTVEITGNVAGDNLSKWELLLFPNGEINEGNKVYLTGGTEAGEVSYELDTTKYPDGTHALVLRVVDPTSNYTDYPVSVTVANAEAAS